MSEHKNSSFKRYYHLTVDRTIDGSHTLCGEYIPRFKNNGEKARVEGRAAQAGRALCPECDSMKFLHDQMQQQEPLVVPYLLDEVDDIMRQLNA